MWAVDRHGAGVHRSDVHEEQHQLPSVRSEGPWLKGSDKLKGDVEAAGEFMVFTLLFLCTSDGTVKATGVCNKANLGEMTVRETRTVRASAATATSCGGHFQR